MMSRSKGQLSISRDSRGDSYWRTKATNGNTLAGSTEGYRNSGDMRKALVVSTAIQLAALNEAERKEVLAYLETEGENGGG